MSQRICTIPDCGRKVNAKGLCHGHYWRLQTYGDAMPDKPLRKLSRHDSPTCSFAGCDRPTHAVDLCRSHRRQVVREGAARRIITTIDLEERFFRYVEQAGDCWRWVGNLDDAGYGLHIVDRRNKPAHRWSYEYLRAEIPDGLCIDHLCRNRWCVNPWHLEPVTLSVNTSRGWMAARGEYNLYP